jgi:phosphoglycolate phosphatase
MSDLRLVVFDVDGTLVDSAAHIVAAMTAAFARCGLPVPEPEAVRAIIGLSLPVAIARLLPGADDRDIAALREAYKSTWNGEGRAGNLAPLFPGARAALDRLAAQPDVLLGLATGKSRRGLLHLMAAHGFDGLFVTVQTADEHPSKPHPSMLAAALSETGTQAAGAVMIGDTTYDIEMGVAAGFASLGVAWGCHDARALLAVGARGIVERFDDLDAMLDALWEPTA